MKVIQRYILLELLKSFILTFVVLTSIVFVISTWQIIRYYGEYLQITTILSAIPFVIGKSISFTLPMSLLPAVTITYGRMTHENEILILRTTGIYAISYLIPAFIIGVFFSLVCLYLNCEIIPWMNKKRDALTRYAVELIISTSFSSGQNTIDFIPDVKIRYDSLSRGKFNKLFIQRLDIQKFDTPKNDTDANKQYVSQEIIAQSGSLVFDTTKNIINFQLENGVISHIDREHEFGKTIVEKRFSFKYISIPIQLYAPENEMADRAKYKRIGALIRDTRKMGEQIERLRASGKIPQKFDSHNRLYKTYYQDRVAIHERFSNAFTPIIIILIGAPLGILIRHSNPLVAFGVSAIPMFVFYYPMMMVGRTLGEEAILPAFIGAWMSNVFMLILGFFLIIYISRK
ncbi:LptF/LptG family permease [Candidatus Uabimicrobium amorphum]|uniref:Permease n=1 Tax=Uabimicrobium amorphum TaxID=2596890 RepID=A0A5S9IKR6_UABAM|nr:LptF/LptG family permease [Candidatus Uabimicrobium amorphum]BBM83246.1 permease [Candidatus Uabimicrobium amorphum]